MVIREQPLRVLPFGARPFHAIVLAGAAAGERHAQRKDAERFLRAAEPPAHDNWTATPELTTQYARGARQRIVHDFPTEVQKAVKRQITVEIEHGLGRTGFAQRSCCASSVPRTETAKRPRVSLLEGAARTRTAPGTSVSASRCLHGRRAGSSSRCSSSARKPAPGSP